MKNTGATASPALPTQSKAIDVATKRLPSLTSKALLLDMEDLLRKLQSENCLLSPRAASPFRFGFGCIPNAEEIAMAASMGDY